MQFNNKYSTKLEWGTGYAQENYNKTLPLDFAPHVHFDHDPLWNPTFLIYINDHNRLSGKSLFSLGGSKDERIKNWIKWNNAWHSDEKEEKDYKIKIERKKINLKEIKTVDL